MILLMGRRLLVLHFWFRWGRSSSGSVLNEGDMIPRLFYVEVCYCIAFLSAFYAEL